jgi:hypothetical protein
LHQAVIQDDLEILKVLIEAGADVDMLDYKNTTAIQLTGNSRVYARLVAAGSKSGWLDSTSWDCLQRETANLSECFAKPFFKKGRDSFLPYSKNLPGPIGTLFSRPINTFSVFPKALRFLLEREVDINLTDYSQKTFIHSALCSKKSTSYLLSLPQIFDSKPFPWHVIGRQLQTIPWSNEHWRLFTRRIPLRGVQNFMNLHPEQGISPLCQAAAIDAVHIIDRCLEMGANINYEGSSYGSALSTHSEALSFPSFFFFLLLEGSRFIALYNARIFCEYVLFTLVANFKL